MSETTTQGRAGSRSINRVHVITLHYTNQLTAYNTTTTSTTPSAPFTQQLGGLVGAPSDIHIYTTTSNQVDLSHSFVGCGRPHLHRGLFDMVLEE